MKYSTFIIAFFATIVQFYDYALFGLAAATLAREFMPSSQDDAQLLQFFAIIAFTVIAKPVGALIFGYIGDKYSRSSALKLSTLLALLTTAAIAFIPSFKSIGYLSTALLIICRMLFLVSQAGEIDVTRIYIAEKLTSHKNLANGIVSFCTQLGALLAATSYHFSLSFSKEYIWRVNFILGGIAGLIVLSMRNSLKESELFIASKNKRIATKFSDFIQITKDNKRNFLIAIFINGAIGGSYNFLIIFFNIFAAKTLNLYTIEQARLMNILLISCYGISTVLSGYIADKINPYRQIIIAIVIIYFSYATLLINIDLLTAITIILVILMAFYSVPLQIIMQSLFKIDQRARLCSLSHSIGGMIFSSTVPFFSMLAWQYTNSLKLVLSIYLWLVSVLFLMIKILR